MFGADGEPRHERGYRRERAGALLRGPALLYAFSSTMIHSVGRDAERIAFAVAASGRPGRRKTTERGVTTDPAIELGV